MGVATGRARVADDAKPQAEPEEEMFTRLVELIMKSGFMNTFFC